MTHGPRVSVVCTVRNGASTLSPVIASVRAQTMREWEFLVVDDGSVDGTAALVGASAAEDPRIRLLTTRGIGRGAALNLGLSAARGAYVANVDADDPSHPRRLELQAAALDREPRFGLLGAGTVYARGGTEPAWPGLPADPEKVAPLDVTSRLAWHNPVNHSALLASRDVLRSVGGYDAARPSQFDYDLLVRLAAAGHRIGNLPLPLASKRFHAGQAFERRRRLHYLRGNAEVQARAIRALGGGAPAWCFYFGRLGWGLVPAGVRDRCAPAVRRWWGES